MARLTREQAQEIIGYLQSGQEVPDDYRHLLFPPERREYELVYAGKEREEDIVQKTWGVPLQAVKTFNVPKGQPAPHWTNRLIFGDNLQVMKRLLDDPDVRGKVKLVYIDPPFATKQDFQGSQGERAYVDKVVGAQFIEFMRRRLVLIRELLAHDGFLAIHLDYRFSHYIKIVLDEVMEGNFRNDIKVPRGTKNVQNQFETISSLTTGDDSILLYSRRPTTRLPHLRIELDEMAAGKWDTFWRGTDRPTMRYRLFNQKPSTGQWRWKQTRAEEAVSNYNHYLATVAKAKSLDEHYLHSLESGTDLDFVRLNDEGVVQYYVPPRDNRVASTVWIDVRTLGKVTSYPTEKHEALLERVIGWLSSEREIVLDAFAGSGTTCAVSEKLGRRWIGIDCGKLAIYTIQKRMLNLCEEIGNRGKKLEAKPFTLYNAGLYDFARMKDLSWPDYRRFALQLFQVRDQVHTVSGITMDGFKGTADVLIFNFKEREGVQVDEEYIASLHEHLGSQARDEFFLIAPASRVTFLEDYIDHGNTRYYILRIPYSIIDELHDRPFQEIRQPVDETEINNTVEAVGFDFVVPPKVKATYTNDTGNQLFPQAVIHIKDFRSHAMTRKPREFANRETLSMVMVDFDYKGNGEGVFDLDAAFYRDQIEAAGWKVVMEASALGPKCMIIYMDIFGNELREVKTPKDFGIETIAVKETAPTYAPPKLKAAKPTVKGRAAKPKSGKSRGKR